VTVRDRLPAGVTLVSANASQGSGCTAAGTAPVTITCHLGTLASGGHAAIVVVVRLTGPTLTGSIGSRATISSSTTADPTPDNNVARATTVLP
jgi:hypothetical protein